MNLRQQQDFEYEECLQNDIIKTQQKLILEAEKEAELQYKKMLEVSYQDYIHSKRIDEPNNENNEQIILIRFVCPTIINETGKINTKKEKLVRRFLKTNTINDIYEFLIVHFYDVYNIMNPQIKLYTYNQLELINNLDTLATFNSRETLYVTLNQLE